MICPFCKKDLHSSVCLKCPYQYIYLITSHSFVIGDYVIFIDNFDRNCTKIQINDQEFTLDCLLEIGTLAALSKEQMLEKVKLILIMA